MSLIAVGFGISKTGREIIQNIAENIFECDIEIIDAKFMEVDFNPTDYILCFGTRPLKEILNKDNCFVLPDLKKLEPDHEDEREFAYSILLEAKETIANSIVLSDSDLPNLSCDKVLAIENKLKSSNQNSWKGKTKDGRSVEIFLVPTKSTADISLTFAELYALKTAIEVLDIDKIVIS